MALTIVVAPAVLVLAGLAMVTAVVAALADSAAGGGRLRRPA